MQALLFVLLLPVPGRTLALGPRRTREFDDRRGQGGSHLPDRPATAPKNTPSLSPRGRYRKFSHRWRCYPEQGGSDAALFPFAPRTAGE